MPLSPHEEQIWIKATKVDLDKEIEDSFGKLEAIPCVEKCEEASFWICFKIDAGDSA